MLFQHLGRAEAGVHGPMGVGRDQDQAAAGGSDVASRSGAELDSEASDVVGEDLPELVVGDLADEGGLEPERGQARDRVRRRTAAELASRPHGFVKLGGLGFVDQPHRPLGHADARHELVAGIGDHVDDGVADGENVKAMLAH